jgi:hypothetical protein
VSPTAIAVTAAGVGVGIWDRSVVVAVILGAGAWCGRMVAAVIARRRRDRQAWPRPAALDPWSVPEPWRQLLQQALSVQTRFDQTIDGWADGPIKDRLTSLRPNLYASMEQVGTMAKRGAAIAGGPGGGVMPGRVTAGQLTDQLRKAEAERQRLDSRSAERAAALARTEDAIAAQLRAVRSAEEAANLVHDRVRILVATLDQTVTSLAVLGVGAAESGADAVAASLSALTDEISALHRGLTEATSSATPGAALPHQDGGTP